MSVTQKELARRMGVSQTLVGRVLNGTSGVAEGTRHRILEEARRLGYTAYSNHHARSLVARRHGRHALNGIIGALFQSWEGEGNSMRGAPYFMPLFQGVETAARERGVEVILCPMRDGEIPRVISEGTVDGLIAIFPPGEPKVRTLDMPVISISRQLHGVHYIGPNDRDGAKIGTEYLIGLGHRRIAYLGHLPDFFASIERLAGFREAMEAANIPIVPELLELTIQQNQEAEAAEKARQLLGRSRDFTALVCYNDTIAMGAIREFQAQGIRVPEDVSVIGFDDLSTIYNFSPTVTSLRSPNLEMGERAVKLLYELCHSVGEKQSQDAQSGRYQLRHEQFPVELMVRESTAPVRG